MRGTDASRLRSSRGSRATAGMVPADHPLRAIRAVADEVLKELSPEFSRIYSSQGRPSIPPEKLLRALLLQVLYGVQSERLLLSLLSENPVFRWFVGLDPKERVWHATTLTKNRARLRDHDVARHFFDRVQAEALSHGVLTQDGFAIRRDGAPWSRHFAWVSAPLPQPV
jgi:transposase